MEFLCWLCYSRVICLPVFGGVVITYNCSRWKGERRRAAALQTTVAALLHGHVLAPSKSPLSLDWYLCWPRTTQFAKDVYYTSVTGDAAVWGSLLFFASANPICRRWLIGKPLKCDQAWDMWHWDPVPLNHGLRTCYRTVLLAVQLAWKLHLAVSWSSENHGIVR